MKTIPLDIPDLLLLEPKVFADKRGFFMETYRQSAFADLGMARNFVQDNYSGSTGNVLRGLHYQINNAQAKLVRVTQGEVYDVAVDIRRGSPWFGKFVGVVLSAENHRMFYLPEGFAHGYYVLSERAEFTYKCSNYYSPPDERGIRWDDPGLAVDWPIPPDLRPVVSDKDAAYGFLADIPEADLPVYTPRT